MGIGCGTDLVLISRINDMCQKWGDRFLDRIYTKAEKKYCQGKQSSDASFAARFAAKEAVSKALGTGIGSNGVSFLDIEVQTASNGRPDIHLWGKTLDYFSKLGGRSVSISLSHDGNYAVAFCVMEFMEDCDEISRDKK